MSSLQVLILSVQQIIYYFIDTLNDGTSVKAAEDQAIARAQRQGQTSQVTVVR